MLGGLEATCAPWPFGPRGYLSSVGVPTDLLSAGSRDPAAVDIRQPRVSGGSSHAIGVLGDPSSRDLGIPAHSRTGYFMDPSMKLQMAIGPVGWPSRPFLGKRPQALRAPA